MIRFFDILFSLIGLLLLAPVWIIIAIGIVTESRGGAFYKQIRVGKTGKDFLLYKFRSMRSGSDQYGLLTVGADSRITSIGKFIRKYKIDELPQLYNVFKGDMSLVGPRPEVRKYVNMYSKEQLKVLEVLPGLTDYASIEYVDENKILAESVDSDKVYIEQIMPAKIKLNLVYIENRNIKNYFRIIFLTLSKIIHRN
ncbi:MAG: sugar transferase [Bacteroidales bacterium]